MPAAGIAARSFFRATMPQFGKTAYHHHGCACVGHLRTAQLQHAPYMSTHPRGIMQQRATGLQAALPSIRLRCAQSLTITFASRRVHDEWHQRFVTEEPFPHTTVLR